MNSAPASASVLFICSYNAIRSPLAAALFNHLTQGRLRADSAGLFTEGGHPLTSQTMAEVSATAAESLSHHQPKSWQTVPAAGIELVVVLSAEANRYAEQFSEKFGCPVEYWPTTDPTEAEGNHEQRLMAFGMVREEIAARLKKRFPECNQ
ncbi:MAG: hypothetical protein QM523_10590 [Candidatus Pacebacteria bacterium]|nr:hypothetical protein [Candidatus Paceibacterota bacterium]